MILTGSTKETIITVWMKYGLVFKNTIVIVSEYHAEEERAYVGISAVRNIIRRMMPVIRKIK